MWQQANYSCDALSLQADSYLPLLTSPASTEATAMFEPHKMRWQIEITSMKTLKIQLLGRSIVNGGGKRRHGRGVARISFQCRDCGGVGMHQLNTSGTGLNKAAS